MNSEKAAPQVEAKTTQPQELTAEQWLANAGFSDSVPYSSVQIARLMNGYFVYRVAAGVTPTPATQLDAVLDEMVRDFTTVGVRPKSEVRRRLLEWKAAAPGSTSGAGQGALKPRMTFGEWCDMNVLQPTMGNVDLYVCAMLAASPAPPKGER